MPQAQAVWKFDKCPHCGSTERIADSIVKPMRDKGEIKKDSPTGAFISPIHLGNPSAMLTALTVPSLLTIADVCAKCGTVYAVYVELTHVPSPAMQQPGKFGRG